MIGSVLSGISLRMVAIALLAIAATGCGDDGGEQGESAPWPESKTEVTDPGAAAERQKLYDRGGRLLESDTTIAGLTLPKGLEPFFEKDRRHAFRTGVPLDKLQAYFGPRLMTGEVERVGEGAIFRHAVPRDVQGGVVKLDVKVLPGSEGNRVEIEEIPPPPKSPPSLEQLREQARDQQLE